MKVRTILGALPVAAFLMLSEPVQAQISLDNVLKNVAGQTGTTNGSSAKSNGITSALTSIFDSKKIAKAEDLVGNWNYTEPAVVFTSSNFLKSASGKVVSAAIEKKLQAQLNKYGIKKGSMKMTFDKDGKFTQTVAGKTVKGTYTVSGKNVKLSFGGVAEQFLGTTQVDGNDLLIVMDATKLMSYMKTLGALSGNSTLKTASSLLGSMDGMLCGLRLQK